MPRFASNGAAVQNEMTQSNSMEAFIWGLKKASSRARELAEAQQNKAWLDVAKILDAMREKGVILGNQKAMRSQYVDRALDQIKSKLIVN